MLAEAAGSGAGTRYFSMWVRVLDLLPTDTIITTTLLWLITHSLLTNLLLTIGGGTPILQRPAFTL